MTPNEKTGYTPQISRYTTAARMNHWVVAISLILLALSGMSLFHPSLFWLASLFGGGALVRAVHPWIGVVLFVSFTGMFLRFWSSNLWTRADTEWLKNAGNVAANHEERVPEVGKYNAGQKLVFWAMSLLIIGLIVSGVVIWDAYFAAYTTIDAKRLALLAHAMAAVAIIVVWIVHVYAAIWVRGTIEAMTKGSVTAGWAYRHHRKWLREEAASGNKANPAE